MENKIYFIVQDVKKINCGYKTYINSVEKSTVYEEEEIKKAIKHYLKRKSNEIIMCCVEFFDKAPYTKTTEDFGKRNLVDIEYDNEYNGTIIDFSKDHNERIKECIDFYDLGIRYYI